MNVFILTVKGLKNLTEQCLRTFNETVDPRNPSDVLVVVDAAQGSDATNYTELKSWLSDRKDIDVIYAQWPNCTLTQGWNAAIFLSIAVAQDPTTTYIHLMQNDLVFFKKDWLTLIDYELIDPTVGCTGTSGMSVFGRKFVTGAIQSFRLDAGISIVEDGKFIDESFNHAFPDVDLCFRFEKAGYHNVKVENIEYGEDPYITHLISQTMYTEHGLDKTMEMRADEEKIFCEKWNIKK